MCKVIGWVVTEWAATEYVLALIFARLVGSESGVMLEALFFEAVESFNGKRTLLTELARYAFTNSRKRKRFVALLQELQTLSTRRNAYAHGRYFVSEDHPDDLLWTRRVHPKQDYEAEVFTFEQIRETGLEIIRVRQALVKLTEGDYAHTRRGADRQTRSIPAANESTSR